MGNLLRKSRKVIKSVPNAVIQSKKVVIITGCDSGLGYSLSQKCNQMGLTVVSGCLSLESEGAQKLSNNCYVYNLDVTDSKSVRFFFEKVQSITNQKQYELHALVNNAGVMIFGEFEWYTEAQILQQIEVNMIGTFRMAKIFLPLLRKHQGRLINITSHCAISNLPTLTVYGATKAAIQSWTDGLRQEQKKTGVKVINFIPGSFVTQSNIMAKQQQHFEAMERCFSEEDKQIHGEYFKTFNLYLSHVAGDTKPLAVLEDDKLYEKFTEALLSENPKATYKHEPWRYFFYYNAFKISPVWLKDYLIQIFLGFSQCKQASK